MSALVADTETWGLAVGALTPLLVAVIQQPQWTPRVRVLIGWVCALVLGLVTCLARGDLGDGATVVRTCLLVLLSAQAVLVGWQKLGVVPAIEKKTTVRKRGSDRRRRRPAATPPP